MATMVQAIRMALHVGEERLGVTDIFGEDVGAPLGGVFTATQGLKTAWNSPLDERGIIGAAMGLALAGQKPVCEIQFCDYAFNTIDLLKLAGGMYWSSNGQYNLPMVTMMTPVGSGIHGSLYHSHSFDAQATRTPGWKIVIPSEPARRVRDACCRPSSDPNPVMFLAPKALLPREGAAGRGHPGRAGGRAHAEQDDRRAARPIARSGHRSGRRSEDLFIPLGAGAQSRSDRHAADRRATYARMVQVCYKSRGRTGEGRDVSVEVIDLRSLHPYDWKAIKTHSVKKTNRLLCVNEDTEITNFGEHLIRRAAEELFYELHAPPKLLAGRALAGNRPRRQSRASRASRS